MSRARRRAEELIALAWAAVPRQFEGAGEFEEWTTFAPAAAARCAYLLESILALADREPDGEIVTRTLFDWVATFAWIAAASDTRLGRWVAADLRSRITMAERAAVFGHAAMPADVEQDFRGRIATGEAIGGRAPKLEQMVKEADEHWGPAFQGEIFAGRGSLSAFYAVYFRGFSTASHPTAISLAPFIGRLGPTTLQLGRPMLRVRERPLESGAAIFSSLLFLTGALFGWPSHKALVDVWRRHPATVPETVPE
jgi:hypothetical protein